MVRKTHQSSRVKEIADKSQFWDVDDLIRNFEEEMARLEHGLDHMIWDIQDNRVTPLLRPLPLTPAFDISENEKEIELRVRLPGVSKDSIRLNVAKNSIELFACAGDLVCRPYYMSLDVKDALDADSATAELEDWILVVKVLKAKKKRLQIK